MDLSVLHELEAHLSGLPNGTRVAIVLERDGAYWQCKFNRLGKQLLIEQPLKTPDYWLSVFKDWPVRRFDTPAGKLSVYKEKRR